MAGYQYVCVIGNVGADPDLRYTQTGAAVTSFSVAVNRRWTDRQTGEPRESVTWFKVTAWRALAETCQQYVHKGMLVMVAGEIDASAYIDQSGEARASLDLTAQQVQFLGGRGEQGGREAEQDEMPF